MTWETDRLNIFSDRPGPSLHNTAAAPSLTSFIVISGQPKSRKRQRSFIFPKAQRQQARFA
jgi:hypothetical protein